VLQRKKINQTNLCISCTPTLKEYNKTAKASKKGRLNAYRGSAKARGKNFSLTMLDIDNHWQESCSYCGDEITTIGLDRVDTERGYEPDNIVSCCKRCNEMKMDEELSGWVSRMKRVLRNMGETL